MIDQRLVRDNPTLISNGLSKRGIDFDISKLQKMARLQRDLEEKRSILQAKGNRLGKEVGELIKNGKTPNSKEILDLRQKGNEIKQEVSLIEEEEKTVNLNLKANLLSLPNLPSEDCPLGKDERDNQEVIRWGNTREDKGLKNHWEIGENLKLFETEKTTKLSQSRFVTLINEGARLERALINFMLDIHTSNGYKEILPPALINTSSLTGSGQLPKFADEIFRCSPDDLWLTPTAEVQLTSLHRDEIIASEDLPLRYVAYSPCFRREAGSYGRDTRGLIRLHQFNKVELYWFAHPEKSNQAHDQITKDARSILEALELPYRVIQLCTGDIGFSASKTFDLEVWLPGARAYREISSCSHCGDFQARRSSIRTKDGKTTRLVHTLNGSGLAVGRTMAALIENGQQKDGSIVLPDALSPYFGKTIIKPE